MADVAEKLDPEVLPEYIPSAVLDGEAREDRSVSAPACS